MAGSDQGALVVTVPEAAQLLGISRTHAYELVARGDLAAIRLGRRIVVPKHAIESLLGLAPDVPAAS
jgi:excisionase family DNA binding protein